MNRRPATQIAIWVLSRRDAEPSRDRPKRQQVVQAHHPDGPTLLTTDNLAAISFAQDHQFHARSKHIDIRHHFVRERVLDSTIRITHCSSEDNCADILTKPLGRIIHEKQLALINLASR